MAGPVRQLVQSGGVVVGDRRERRPRRQLDEVFVRRVERSRSAVPHVCPGRPDQFVSDVQRVPDVDWRRGRDESGRQAVHLGNVEDCE